MMTVIRKYAALPFAWDGRDCCSFVAECIESITGENLNLTYRTEDEANEIIASHGGLEATITSVLGRPYFGVREGYVALVKLLDRDVAGIIYRGRIVCRTMNGLVDLPLWRASRVWRTW